MRGGFTLRVTMVRKNRGYLESRRVNVPWTKQNLTVKWEHFVSKLKSGRKETWTAVIAPGEPPYTNGGIPPKGGTPAKAVAEMAAALYDQSLDAYLPHAWQAGFGVFRQDWCRMNEQFENMAKQLNREQGGWPLDQRNVQIRRLAGCLRASRSTSGATVTLWGGPEADG